MLKRIYSFTRVFIVTLLPTCFAASGSGSRTKVKLLAGCQARVQRSTTSLAATTQTLPSV